MAAGAALGLGGARGAILFAVRAGRAEARRRGKEPWSGARPGARRQGGAERGHTAELLGWRGAVAFGRGGAVLPEGTMHILAELLQSLWVLEEQQGSGGQQNFRSKQ